MQPELFPELETLDPKIERAVKDMKRNGFDYHGIESLFSNRLKVTGQGKLIPAFRRQMEIIRRKK